MMRYECALKLTETRSLKTAVPEWLTIRRVTRTDSSILADLILETYPNAGRNREDAYQEIERFFQGAHDKPLLNCSWLVFVRGDLASACLVSLRKNRKRPLLRYIMTTAFYKEQGLTKLSLDRALQTLAKKGYTECLFTHIGFVA